MHRVYRILSGLQISSLYPKCSVLKVLNASSIASCLDIRHEMLFPYNMLCSHKVIEKICQVFFLSFFLFPPSLFLSFFCVCVWPSLILFTFILPKETVYVLAATPHFFPVTQPQAVTDGLSVPLDLPSLDISYKWNHTVCGLL